MVGAAQTCSEVQLGMVASRSVCLALPSTDKAADLASPLAELTVSDLPAVLSASPTVVAATPKSGTPAQA